MEKTFTFKVDDPAFDGMPFDAPEGGRIVSDKICSSGRWSLLHELIFQTSDQIGTEFAWRCEYSVGATEYQDEGPWQYADKVDCRLVKHVEKTVKVWEPVS